MKIVPITPYYTLSMQRKITHMANATVQIRQILPRTYQRQINPILAQTTSTPQHQLIPVPLLAQSDPHRAMFCTTLGWLRDFKPDILAVEWDADTLIAVQMAMLRNLWTPKTKLILHSWQNIARFLKILPRQVLNFTLKQADCIFCTNQDGPGVLRQWGYQGKIIQQPWVGVDTTIFHWRPPVLREKLALDGFLIGYIGRLTSEKGIDGLIRAITQLPREIQCVLIGEGNAKTELKVLAQSLGIEKRVHFLGSVANEALADYYAMFDVFALPSLTTEVWKEQYGRVLLEAMACEIPIIGSDSGAIPEVIGKAGLIFPEKDYEAIAKCILTLYEDRNLCQTLAQQGQIQVQERFSQAQIAAHILEIYAQL